MSNLADLSSPATAGASAETTVPAEEVSYVSRQPILDGHGAVFGYELHFHARAKAPARDGLSAASRRMLDTLALFGVERFTAGAWGFLDCTADALDAELFEGLAPTNAVLEIPPCPRVSPKLEQACRTLREAGFRIALNDTRLDDTRELLFPLADYVKVDFRQMSPPEWQKLYDRLKRNTSAIAANVHAYDSYRKARALGFQYFQGYYFCSPDLIPNGSMPVDKLRQLAILRELFKDPLDLITLCPVVMHDPSLVYRVLRFVNSPLCALRNPVQSIESAIVILGERQFRRIATLAVQCNLSRDYSPELLRMALTRATFCGQAAPKCGLDANEMYMTGMLSLLPAMLRVPMNTILPGMPLRAEICMALMGSDVKERCLLSWLESLECNDIAGCEEIAARYGLDKNQLPEMYLNALEEAGRDIPLN